MLGTWDTASLRPALRRDKIKGELVQPVDETSLGPRVHSRLPWADHVGGSRVTTMIMSALREGDAKVSIHGQKAPVIFHPPYPLSTSHASHLRASLGWGHSHCRSGVTVLRVTLHPVAAEPTQSLRAASFLPIDEREVLTQTCSSVYRTAAFTGLYVSPTRTQSYMVHTKP